MSRHLLALCVLCGCFGDPPASETGDSDDSNAGTEGPTSTGPTGATESATETSNSGSGSATETSDGSSESGTSTLEPWELTRNGSGNWHDAVHGIAIDPATGDVLVAGDMAPAPQDRDPWLARFASDGTEIWSVVLDEHTPFDDSLAAVAIDNTGAIVVTGQIGRAETVPMEANADTFVARFAADGTLDWSVELDLADQAIWDTGNGIALDGADNIFVAASARTMANHIDAYVVKLGPGGGDPDWVYVHDAPTLDADFAYAIAVDADDEVCWTGSETEPTMPIQSDAVVGCIRNDGVELWTTVVEDDVFYDFGNAIALDQDRIVVAGKRSVGTMAVNTAQPWLATFAPNGAPAWSTVWMTEANSQAFGVALSDDGSIWVTGAMAGPEGDAFIARWEGQTDAPEWSELVGEPGVGDSGLAIAAAPGRVVVGGFVAEAGQGSNAWLRQIVL